MAQNHAQNQTDSALWAFLLKETPCAEITPKEASTITKTLAYKADVLYKALPNGTPNDKDTITNRLCEAICKAARKYDKTKGATIATYLCNVVKHSEKEVWRYLLAQKRCVSKRCPITTSEDEEDYASSGANIEGLAAEEPDILLVVDLRDRIRNARKDPLLRALMDALLGRDGVRKGIHLVLGWTDYAARVQLARLDALFPDFKKKSPRKPKQRRS